MKKIAVLLFTAFTCLTLWSQKPAPKERSTGKVYGPITTKKNQLERPRTPDEIWGKLFVDVQLNRVLGDNKTFVDVIPKMSPEIILKKYDTLKSRAGTQNDIKAFVEQNFKIPVPYNPKLPAKNNTLKEHLEQLWPILTRKADVREKNSSLLPLPYSYVVPGGRFREIYYWDSYFTMLGLAVSNRFDLIENMLDNFKYLIDTYGHIPNGNRSYYLSRSQPPYFALMVDLLAQKKGDRIYKKYLSAMLKEYGWWMEGEKDIEIGGQHRRIVKLADGTVLNRYWDDKEAPREESYYQDVQTGLTHRGTDKLVYTNLRAGAESGWDFSSRWFADTMSLSTIETTNIIPVDLNCLLYKYEVIINKALTSQKQTSKGNAYTIRAEARKASILQYCWNENERYFFDYHFIKQATTNKWSLAGVLSIFTGVATPEQARFVKAHIEQRFLRDGGLLTTPYRTGQQWDAPNGWAPLQYLSIQGLMNYGYDTLARTIAGKWMQVNEKVFEHTGKMMEKYNVEDIHLESGGGEYPSQDGFGWSNGVYLKLYSMFRDK